MCSPSTFVVVLLLIGLNIQASTSSCPFGLSRYYCKANPCEVTTCSGQSESQCNAQYCGGCHAIWTQDSLCETFVQPARCECPSPTECCARQCPQAACSPISGLPSAEVVALSQAECFELSCGTTCSKKWLVKYNGEFYDVTSACTN